MKSTAHEIVMKHIASSIPKVMFTFIRHGKTDWDLDKLFNESSQDLPLNEIGINQVKATGELFSSYLASGSNLMPTTIYSSPLLRAQQTAQIIAESIKFQGNIHLHNGLQERYFGNFTTVKQEDYPLGTEFALLPKSKLPKDAESVEQFEQRILGTFKFILGSAKKGDNIAIVAHSGVFQTVTKYLTGKAVNINFSGVFRVFPNESGWQCSSAITSINRGTESNFIPIISGLLDTVNKG